METRDLSMWERKLHVAVMCFACTCCFITGCKMGVVLAKKPTLFHIGVQFKTEPVNSEASHER